MADLAPTNTAVKYISGPVGHAPAGVAITAGEVVYIDGSDKKARLAIATTKTPARAVGIAINEAAAEDQMLDYAMPGAIVDLGGGTQASVYIVSGATAGAMSPTSDATTPASGEYLTVATLCLANSRHLVVCAVAEVALA